MQNEFQASNAADANVTVAALAKRISPSYVLFIMTLVYVVNYLDRQILGILKRVEAGQKVADVCREQGISDATFSRWKAQHGGLEVSQLRRLRQLEDENRRLTHLVADLALDNQALKDLTTNNW